MTEERIETAVMRIEAALARISDVADKPDMATGQASSTNSALVDKHETLRETVSNTLNKLDELIEELDQ